MNNEAKTSNRLVRYLDGSSIALIDSIVEPLSAFRSLHESPRALFALIGAAVCQLTITLLYFSPDIHGFAVLGSVMFVGVTVLVPMFFVTLWLWVAGLLFEGRLQWGTIFSMVAHCTFAATVVALVWTLGELSLGVSASVHPAYTSLAFLADDKDFVMRRAGQAVDIITLYYMILLTLGVRTLFAAEKRAFAIGALWAGWLGVNGVAIAVKYMVAR